MTTARTIRGSFGACSYGPRRPASAAARRAGKPGKCPEKKSTRRTRTKGYTARTPFERRAAALRRMRA